MTFEIVRPAPTGKVNLSLILYLIVGGLVDPEFGAIMILVVYVLS